MIDIRWNDRPAAGHFIADELGRDVFGNACAERLAFMLEVQIRTIALRRLVFLFPAEIFTNRDEVQFRRDYSLPRVMQLRDSFAAGGVSRLAPQPRNLPAQAAAAPALPQTGA